MIVPADAVRVVIATRPVDFRRGHDSLAALAAAERTRRDSRAARPRDGGAYLGPGETLDLAVHRAAAPMRHAFPPHTGS